MIKTGRCLGLACLSLLTLSARCHSALITDFGSTVAGDMLGDWAIGYNATTSSVMGTVGPGRGIQDSDTPFGSILGNTMFRLTANLSIAPARTFSITVFDEEGDTAHATFHWADFGAGYRDEPIVFDFGFNSSPIAWELATSGFGESIQVDFVRLEAIIPEPGANMLLGIGSVALLLLRKGGLGRKPAIY